MNYKMNTLFCILKGTSVLPLEDHRFKQQEKHSFEDFFYLNLKKKLNFKKIIFSRNLRKQ